MQDKEYAANEKKRFRYLRIVLKVKQRAVKKGLPFDLDQYYPDIRARLAKGRCELTGTQFNMNAENGQPVWNSPSIDRIKPELGYVYSNIRIILHSLNCAFGSWGENVFAAIAESYLEKN